MAKTKIVATTGPACSSKERLRELIRAGVDVFRLNMSHGDQRTHQQVMDLIKSITSELANSTAILVDLQGPKIRLGTFRNGQPVELRANQRFILTTENIEGTAEAVTISYKTLPQEVKVGDRILVDDGLIELRVIGVTEKEVMTQVVFGGILQDHKGVNLPDTPYPHPPLRRKTRMIFNLLWPMRWITLLCLLCGVARTSFRLESPF